MTSAAVVMITVPFGVAAAIYALWLTGTTIAMTLASTILAGLPLILGDGPGRRVGRRVGAGRE